MINRPAIITRRRLVTGAAALAMMPRAARAAPSVTWNPADKDSNITLTGGNLIAENTGSGSYRTVRSTVSKNSGLWYVEHYIFGSSSGTIGLANATASLASGVGVNADSVGADLPGGLYINGSNISAWPAPTNTGNGISLSQAFNLNTMRMWGRWNPDTTWYGAGGTSGDPAAGTNGADISSVTGALFAAVSPWLGRMGRVHTNFGWQAMLYDVPSGFSGIDTAYPVSDVASGYPFIATSGATSTLRINNNMTIRADNASAWDTYIVDKAIPPGAKVMVSFYIARSSSIPTSGVDSGAVTIGFVRKGSTLAGQNLGGGVDNSFGYVGNGSVQRRTTGATTLATIATYFGGSFIDMRVDRAAKTVSFRQDGGAWSADYDFTAIDDDTLCVGASVQKDSAITVNIGASAFAYAVPSGYVSLFDASTGGAGPRGRLIVQ